MNSFSISELAQYSGIKPHTIRIWEKRYQALKPKRSSGNTRHYDSGQLKRLLNISGLLHADYKVSELCAMSDEKLKSLSGKIFSAEVLTPTEYFITQLIAAALTYDEPLFDHIFSHCLLKFGIKDTYMQVIYPTLTRIGLMWLNDTMPTANEHFISNLIRQKIFTAIDSLPPPKPESPTWLLFLPENEFHEIGLLFAHYLVRLSGQKSVFLGGNLPELSLRTAIYDLKPENLLVFLVRHELPGKVSKYLGSLNKEAKVKKIYVAIERSLADQLKPLKKVVFLRTGNDLEFHLS